MPERTGKDGFRKLITLTAWAVFTLAVLALIYIGKDFFIPFVIAIFGVYLIKILSRFIGNLKVGGRGVPEWAAMSISFVVIIGFSFLLLSIIADNALRVIDAAPRYQQKFIALQDRVASTFGIERTPAWRDLMRDFNLPSLLTQVASNLAGLLRTATVIFIYGIFILIETRFIPLKLKALFPDSDQRLKAESLLSRIDQDVQTYFGVKTLISLTTAVLSYGVMRFVGLEFAEFWALLIFILNFIPTIGSILATIFPSLLALLQFESFAPFLILLIGITVVQQALGMLLEPNLMGHALNLSPLVVVISLFVWGMLWGIAGMFLCVPLTVILMIILANFPSTRWITILLSKTGRFRQV